MCENKEKLEFDNKLFQQSDNMYISGLNKEIRNAILNWVLRI